MDRRRFLTKSAIGVTACACMAAGLTGCKTMNMNAKLVTAPPKDNRIAIGKLAVGEQAKVTVPGVDAPVLVARISADEVSAISISCSHFGSEIALINGVLECTNHGSQFGSDGQVLNGPASDPVASYTVQDEDGEIFLLVPN